MRLERKIIRGRKSYTTDLVRFSSFLTRIEKERKRDAKLEKEKEKEEELKTSIHELTENDRVWQGFLDRKKNNLTILSLEQYNTHSVA